MSESSKNRAVRRLKVAAASGAVALFSAASALCAFDKMDKVVDTQDMNPLQAAFSFEARRGDETIRVYDESKLVYTGVFAAAAAVSMAGFSAYRGGQAYSGLRRRVSHGLLPNLSALDRR